MLLYCSGKNCKNICTVLTACSAVRYCTAAVRIVWSMCKDVTACSDVRYRTAAVRFVTICVQLLLF